MKKGNWIVRMQCIVLKDVLVEGCTEEEAKENPWDFAESETECEQRDYEVLSVKPNE